MIDLPAGLDRVQGVGGTGVDVVDVERLARALARTPGFARRVFAADELDACAGRPDRPAALAGRFAAKEAVLKALGLGIFDLPLSEIVVTGGRDRPPALELRGAAAAAAAERGIAAWLLSTSHDGGVAAAVAIALDERQPAVR